MNTFETYARPYEARLAEKETIEERLTICRECKSFVDDRYCSVCGCNMRAKATFEAGQCPENKWQKHTDR